MLAVTTVFPQKHMHFIRLSLSTVSSLKNAMIVSMLKSYNNIKRVPISKMVVGSIDLCALKVKLRNYDSITRE